MTGCPYCGAEPDSECLTGCPRRLAESLDDLDRLQLLAVQALMIHDARDYLIRQLRDDGATLAVISTASRLTEMGVSKIARR